MAASLTLGLIVLVALVVVIVLVGVVHGRTIAVVLENHRPDASLLLRQMSLKALFWVGEQKVDTLHNTLSLAAGR